MISAKSHTMLVKIVFTCICQRESAQVRGIPPKFRRSKDLSFVLRQCTFTPKHSCRDKSQPIEDTLSNAPDITGTNKQDPDLRYEYLVTTVAETGEIWGVGTAEGWSLLEDKTQEKKLFLVWPAEVYAMEWIRIKATGETPRKIVLAEFLTTWIPGLTKDGIEIGVFPITTSVMASCPPDALKEDIEEELAQDESRPA